MVACAGRRERVRGRRRTALPPQRGASTGKKPTVPARLRPYLIEALLMLLAAVPAFRGLGAPGVRPLASWRGATRHALALMYCFTAPAHFGGRRGALIAMVPARLPRPATLVSQTGALEIAGAAGLVVPATAAPAGRALAALLVALFPANVRAARRGVAIGGKPATPFPFRALVQVLYIGLNLWASAPGDG